YHGENAFPATGRMAKRRKNRHKHEDWEDERTARRRRRHGRPENEHEDAQLALAEPRKKPPVTCHQCANLIVTRSLVKHVNQSWDRAIAFPTLTCFEQCWTLEDPESVADHAAVIPFLVEGADECPSYRRGYPRDHHGW